MLNRIIKLSLSNRFLVIVFALVLFISGIWVIRNLPLDVFPDLTAPTVVIMTESKSMSAEDVEKLVTFPIETAINGAIGVRRVRSVSQTGFSVVTVEFDWNKDLYLARQIVSEHLTGISSQLPKGVSEPVLAPQTSLLGEVMVIGLTSKSGVTSLQELRTYADWTFKPRLLSTSGVANVAVTGGDVKKYYINLNPSQMTALNVSTQEILEATEDLNANGTGGVIDNWGNEYVITTKNRTLDLEQLGMTAIKLSDNNSQVPITLNDVAKVTIGSEEPRIGDASVNLVEAIRISITKQPNISTIELTEQLDNVINEIKTGLPEDINVITNIFRQEDFIKSSINNIVHALIEGGLLVILILLIFVGNTRVSLISLVAIPLSLFFSIIVMKILGMSLNTMSIGGMAIAVGSLVDDAIIDVENVYKRLKENNDANSGQHYLDVIYEASSEIRSSIWNATLIIIITFIPLFFLTGMEGRMLKPLGIAFIVSLFASMLVAVTITPVLSSFLLTSKEKLSKEKSESNITKRIKYLYASLLNTILNNVKTQNRIIAVTILLFIGALCTFTFMGSSFLPQFNEGSMTIEISAMPGISLKESSNIGTLAEQIVLDIPEVQLVSRKTGRCELDEHALGTNTSELDVPFKLSSRSRKELFADVRNKLSTIPGVAVEIGQPISHRIDMLLSGSQSNIAIKIFGPSLTELYSTGNKIKEIIEDIPGLVDIKVEQLVERPEIHIIPNKILTAYYGIKEKDISDIIETALLGTTVGQVLDNEKYFDIIVRINPMNSITDIESIPISTDKGTIFLSDVAKIVSTTGESTISRENVSRRIIVSANISGENIVGTVEKIKEEIGRHITIPEGYHIEFGGQSESAQRASSTLLFTSLIAILLVFILLYREFRSFSMASTVMINLPFALIGAIYTVAFLGGAVISIPTIIGFISLFGIATRNGILLISHYEKLNHLDITEKIITGSCDRISPIIMTALTSALALIPLVINGDTPGNEIQSPMAIVILGGLITSTLLNLIVIPIVYLKLHRQK